jgi:hypothetical protein
LDFSFTINTYSMVDSIDSFGTSVGVSNLSGIMSKGASYISLGLDVAALSFDTVACGISVAGIAVGATSGAVITSPGGVTTVPGGLAGASIGWATAELGVNQMFIQPANLLALGSTAFTLGSEVLSKDTGMNGTVKIGSQGVRVDGTATLGSGSQLSPYLTIAGFAAPISFISAGFQTSAVFGDLGIIHLPSVKVDAGLSLNFNKGEFEYHYKTKQLAE